MLLHLLIENTTPRAPFLAEHGLSLHFSTTEHQLLFDMGQSDAFLLNAAACGIDISAVTHAILSHGHYDHAGGISTFLQMNDRAAVHLHEAAFRQRKNHTGSIAKHKIHPEPTDHSLQHKQIPVGKDIGIPARDTLRAQFEHRFIMEPDYPEHPTEVAPGIYLSGSVPVALSDGRAASLFLVESPTGEWVPDRISDEQFLIIRTSEGLLIVSGCAHAGVTGMVRHAHNLFPNEPLYGFIGGTHARNADNSFIQQLIQLFEQENCQLVVPLHCTGLEAACQLRYALGERVRLLGSGDTLELPEPDEVPERKRT